VPLAAEVKRLFESYDGKRGSPMITADLREVMAITHGIPRRSSTHGAASVVEARLGRRAGAGVRAADLGIAARAGYVR
jgi:hypothetical protein